MTEKKRNTIIFGLLSLIVLIILDRVTKELAVLYLKDRSAFVIWDGVFELHYLENRGAAFGILQGHQLFFLVCTLIVLSFIVFYFLRLPFNRRFLPLRAAGVLLAAGAVGNLVDRTFSSYVVDFLYFKLIDFPIFNVADCYVTVGALLLALLVLFFYKDEDLEYFRLRKEKKKDGDDTV